MRRPLAAAAATLVAVPLAALLTSTTPGTAGSADAPKRKVATVTTRVETPVLYDDDRGGSASGDDPAIWVHPTDPARSLVIVTAKEGGLRVYDLDARPVQRIDATPAPRGTEADGRYNNVDLLHDVRVDGERVDVAAVSDRYNDQVRFWTVDPRGTAAKRPLREVTARGLRFLFSKNRKEVDEEHTAYGVAAWQPHAKGAGYVVVTQEGKARIATVKVVVRGDRIAYRDRERMWLPGSFRLPDGTRWRPCEEPGVGPQFEGVAVDHRTDTLYATQEDVGLWRIPLPLGSGRPRLIDKVTDFGIQDAYDPETEECEPVDPSDRGYGGRRLVADAEGVDVYYSRHRAYVIVSSQGDDTYSVYSTKKGNRPLGTFRVRGRGVDDVNGSDGLAVTNRSVPGYRKGLLVTHDEPETGPGTNEDRDPTSFSYVQWGDIARALDLQVSTRRGNDPRFP